GIEQTENARKRNIPGQHTRHGAQDASNSVKDCSTSTFPGRSAARSDALLTRGPGATRPGPRISGAPFRFAPRCAASGERSPRQNRDRAGPAGGAAVHLDGEANDLEAVGRQQFEIVQLLEMRITDLAPGAVALPDQIDVAGFLHALARERERRVPAPAVGAD